MPSNFQVPHLDYVRSKDPRLAEAFQAVQDAVNTMADQTGSVPQGLPVTPGAPLSMNVTAAGGVFDIAVQDSEPASTGVAPDYFLEYSPTPNFLAPTVVHLGPARNHRANLGNQTLYWRTYKQYGRASQPSAPTYFGNAQTPTAVAGGGAISGPNLLPSAGSGTAPTSGTQGGSGYGKLPVRIGIAQKPGLTPA